MATIRKRLNKNGTVSYLITVSCGYFDGKQITRSMTYTPPKNMSKKKVLKELDLQVINFEQLCKEDGILLEKRTFKSLSEEWLIHKIQTKSMKKGTIGRLTTYKNTTYKYFGRMYVGDIKFFHIQSFIKHLGLDYGLSYKSQKNYLSFVRDVLVYSMRLGYIKEMPFSNVEFVMTPKKERKVYSLEETQKLFNLIFIDAPIKYRAFYALAAYCGMRRGEILGLEFSDFDFENKTVTITRTSNYAVGYGTYDDTPKTYSGYRTLYVDDVVLEVVEKLRDEQLLNAKEAGKRAFTPKRLFLTESGGPMHPNTPYEWLRRCCKREGIPFKGVHAFRHSVATLAIHKGIDIQSVSAILGHADSNVTLSTYVHSVKNSNLIAGKEVASLINDACFEEKEKGLRTRRNPSKN